MYRFLLLAVLLVISGCAPSYPTVANLNLRITPQPPIYNDATISIEGRDKRPAKEVIVYRVKDQMEFGIENMSPPEILMVERLAGGLRDQGAQFVTHAGTRLFLDIDELLAMVTRPKFFYNSEAKTRVTLTIVKDTSSLTKKYERQATKEYPKRPTLEQLEEMLNEQLSDIVFQMLQDEEIRQTIKSK